jgi:GNAT superfamily N-acetyltransferase
MEEIIYTIKPISPEEWLPDRCMNVKDPLDPKMLKPERGCPGLLYGIGQSQPWTRKNLDELYCGVIGTYHCCGFIAWENDRIIGYNNFFPSRIARDINFYGWGNNENTSSDTLVHNCISIVSNDKYRRHKIGTNLIKKSLEWAKKAGWKHFEVHLVLPNIASGFENEQKSALAFWGKIGFSIVSENQANEATKKFYKVDKRYSLSISLENYKY